MRPDEKLEHNVLEMLALGHTAQEAADQFGLELDEVTFVPPDELETGVVEEARTLACVLLPGWVVEDAAGYLSVFYEAESAEGALAMAAQELGPFLDEPETFSAWRVAALWDPRAGTAYTLDHRKVSRTFPSTH